MSLPLPYFLCVLKGETAMDMGVWYLVGDVLAVQLLNSEDQFTKNTGNIDVSQNVKRTEIKRNIMTKFDYTIGTKTGLNCRHVGQLVIRARAFVGTTITREYLSRGISPKR